MIIGNTVRFGYGDVLVGSDSLAGKLTLRNIAPPQEIGTSFNSMNLEDFEIGLEIEITEDNSHDLYNALKSVTRENPILKFKEWTLDFSNYNEESVRIVKKHAFNMVYLFALAC